MEYQTRYPKTISFQNHLP